MELVITLCVLVVVALLAPADIRRDVLRLAVLLSRNICQSPGEVLRELHRQALAARCISVVLIGMFLGIVLADTCRWSEACVEFVGTKTMLTFIRDASLAEAGFAYYR